MTIEEAMRLRNITKYRLSKESGVPYTTLNDICRGKARLEKCSAETIYRIAQALSVSMEDLLEPLMHKRSDFENFKSTVCHRVKASGDIDFIIEILKEDSIRTFFERQWYPESFYLLAMIDYLSRENALPLCEEYEDIRHCRLEKPVYPAGIIAMCAAAGNDQAKRIAEINAIPEFRRFNIIENEVRNVI